MSTSKCTLFQNIQIQIVTHNLAIELATSVKYESVAKFNNSYHEKEKVVSDIFFLLGHSIKKLSILMKNQCGDVGD